MGKLGSREMTASSDLDLVLLYDFDEAHAESDGARRLHAIQYYTRLTQRLVSSLTVATRRGRLYDVDMRLRPSGGQGPVATQLRSFVAYQLHEAETWEHMALTRARVLAGDQSLGVEVNEAIAAVLRHKRDAGQLQKAVRDMRALIASEKGEADPWDLKLAAGGVSEGGGVHREVPVRVLRD
jgi:glutamate-ammonia-ligase adenylyltransferase